jgi:hypothetical protein
MLGVLLCQILEAFKKRTKELYHINLLYVKFKVTK